MLDAGCLMLDSKIQDPGIEHLESFAILDLSFESSRRAVNKRAT
jgi:hypothetical protein